MKVIFEKGIKKLKNSHDLNEMIKNNKKNNNCTL